MIQTKIIPWQDSYTDEELKQIYEFVSDMYESEEDISIQTKRGQSCN